MMIGERLQVLRHEKGLSRKQLVALLPLNYSTYANYETGLREPNSEILQLLSKFFGVSIDYILGLTENRKKADEVAAITDEENEHILQYRLLDAHGKDMVDCVLQKEYERITVSNLKMLAHRANSQQTVTLPVYQQRASAGLGNYLGDGSNEDFEYVTFPATQINANADFGIRVKGDSMEPKIFDGDIVFVKAMPKIDADAIGVFTYEGEAYCKKLKLDIKKSVIFLESLNKSYAPKQILVPENLRTVGLVLGVAERRAPYPPDCMD